MKRTLITAILAIYGTISMAQPATEILLFDIKLKKNSATVSNERNVTNHPGYDSQPFFHPELGYLYYSSFNDDGRSDIRRYDRLKGETTNITSTSEREYSPTVTPDKQFLSCIIQRDNGAQDLGKYPIDGGEPLLIIDNMTVGYHTWIDNSHLALFVLGTPHTLHYVRLPTKVDTVLASNIGRSLHRLPGERAFSFIQKSDSANMIMKVTTVDMKITPVVATPAKSEDIAWTPDGRIISSDGMKLFIFNPRKPEKGWVEIIMQEGMAPFKGVTRIAINTEGNKLAIVVTE